MVEPAWAAGDAGDVAVDVRRRERPLPSSRELTCALIRILRHTYAVVTLEQLQREHIRELGAMNPGQRTTYEQVFGYPLDWVRRRLGHRSVETTFKYLHTLNELAMETRLALVPDEWAEVRVSAEDLSGEVADEQIAGDIADSA